MLDLRLLPNFQLADEDGHERPFHDFLADFNIMAIRRVPVASHGPATELLRSLLVEHRGVGDKTVRGFDIRAADHVCEISQRPHIVFSEQELLTICDSDGSIYRQSGADGDDRFFVVGSDRRVIDVGSLREIGLLSARINRDAGSSGQRIAHAPLDTRVAERPKNFSTEDIECVVHLKK